MADGVTAQNTQDRKKYWRHWTEYCRQVKIDPMLRSTNDRFSLLAVTSFAARVRTGYYGNGSIVKVQTVTKALGAISKTIELAGGTSPIYVEHGVYTTPIQRMVEGFRRQDPPAVAQLAVPVEVAHTAVTAGMKSSNAKEQAIGDLVCIAFYYLLRVGEYTKPRMVTRNGKKVRATRTVQFSAGNIGFWDKDNNAILHDAPLEKLLQAHSATLKITNQKNGKMGQTVHHFCTGKDTSPVKALARRLHHIYKNGGNSDTLLCDYWDENEDDFISITSTDIRTVVRSTVAFLKLDTKGIDPALVGTHSLRSGGAMALKLHGCDDTTIMKYGRWSSLTFTMYIHTQIAHIAKDVALAMSNPVPFLNIAAIKTK